MKLKAEISTKYEDESTSKAISSSLKPDNIQTPKEMQVETRTEGNEVITKIELDGEIETLLATLEDVLSCTSTAEEML